ncbi:LysR family transcriptional regulator [Ramlibacter sp.]|uniref:LysR family transcriptional regulator n=1 Tax=Ramlibacter sp. TaxID=1917967 RepID=UPI003D0A81C5
MNTPFDWNLVPSFLAALDHGSLLGAARALGGSQPTLGRHIALLEEQLGCVLFERTGRGLLPTERALALAAAARAMQSSAGEFAHQATGGASALEGTVRISASDPVACWLLPPILARLRLALPEIQVELVASNAVSNLLQREADIALRMVQPAQASLVARRLGRVTFSACAHRDYLRRRGTPREPGDLLAHELVGADRSTEMIDGFAALGVAVRREAFATRTDDLIAYWQLVRAGLGIGFVADYVTRDDPEVVRLLPMLRIPALPLWLVVHREIRSNRRIRAVYDFLADGVSVAL